MPAPKKTTTFTNTPATATVISPEPLKPENFHQYLRAEIRHATRAVMEELMREELSYFLGAAWGESTTERKGYPNNLKPGVNVRYNPIGAWCIWMASISRSGMGKNAIRVSF